MRKAPVPVLVFAAFFAGTATCQWHIYQTYKKPEFLLDRILLLPRPQDPRIMKCLAAGYESVIVDLLWIRGIQYYAQHFSTLCKPPEKGNGLIGLFHTLVALDPDFAPGYKWGAFILTESMNDPERCPDGARRAIKEFLEPGKKQFPNDYTFPMEAGFTAFWHLRDHESAVRFFEAAAAVPAVPENTRRFLERMIPYIRSEEDSLPSLMFAYDRYLRMFLEPVNESEKQIAEQHLRRIMVRLHIFQLQQAVEGYKARMGQPPASLAQAVEAGLITVRRTNLWPIPPQMFTAGPVALAVADGLPVGPDGETYVYLPKADQVAVRQELEQRQRDLIGLLNHYLAAFREQYGRCPERLEELVPEYLNAIPPDPLEMKLTIDPLDCTVAVEVP